MRRRNAERDGMCDVREGERGEEAREGGLFIGLVGCCWGRGVWEAWRRAGRRFREETEVRGRMWWWSEVVDG